MGVHHRVALSSADSLVESPQWLFSSLLEGDSPGRVKELPGSSSICPDLSLFFKTTPGKAMTKERETIHWPTSVLPITSQRKIKRWCAGEGLIGSSRKPLPSFPHMETALLLDVLIGWMLSMCLLGRRLQAAKWHLLHCSLWPPTTDKLETHCIIWFKEVNTCLIYKPDCTLKEIYVL